MCDDSPTEREIIMQTGFVEDLRYWMTSEPQTAARLMRLMGEICRDPFAGAGRPERLEPLHRNVWSRRLTEPDRVVYMVEEGAIRFLQARYCHGSVQSRRLASRSVSILLLVQFVALGASSSEWLPPVEERCAGEGQSVYSMSII